MRNQWATLWDTETFLWPKIYFIGGELRYQPRALDLFLPPDLTAVVFTPAFLRLADHADGRQLIADRIEHCFGPGGPLTTTTLQPQWRTLSDRLAGPIHLEWARWKGRFTCIASPTTWATASDDLHDHWLAEHPDRSLGYLQDADHHEPIAPAVTPTSRGFTGAQTVSVTPTSGAGTCYLRSDGADPRLPGGGLRPGSTAITSATTIDITDSTLLRAGGWAAGVSEMPRALARTGC